MFCLLGEREWEVGALKPTESPVVAGILSHLENLSKSTQLKVNKAHF